MATHSSILAWRIPRTEEPSGLQSIGSQWDMTKATQQAQSSNGTSGGLCDSSLRQGQGGCTPLVMGMDFLQNLATDNRAQADQGPAAGKSMEEKDPG